MARSAKEEPVTGRAVLLACAAWCVLWPPALQAGKLDQMSLKRWAKLCEVERYQLQIAEDYYTKKDWKVAGAEYEKYLTLYERSEAAPYAQLKWSLCRVKLRKANTAIKEGFQSLLDYWPESPARTRRAANTRKRSAIIASVRTSRPSTRKWPGATGA